MLLTDYWTCLGPLIRRPVPEKLFNLVGVFAYRVGGNATHCVTDDGKNLNVYVNTMAPNIYHFITKFTIQVKG